MFHLRGLLFVAALLCAAPTALAAQLGMVRPGQTITGQLTSGDPTLGDGSHYLDFSYAGSVGDEIIVTLRSSAFDTFLIWGEAPGRTFTTLLSDDDGGGGTDSQLTTTVGPGTPVIRVNSYGAGQTGAFTLQVERVGGASTASAGNQTISAGQQLSAQLTASDPTLGDGSHYRVYLYEGRPGEEIVVTMRSSDFDAYLSGGSWDGGEFSDQDSDDDGAGGTDARLTSTIVGTGVYAIRVNSFGAGETGSYTLTVQSSGGPVVANGGVRTIGAGETVTGRLTEADPQLTDESYYHRYGVSGQPGDRFVVTLTSSDFDTFLVWGRRAGGEFERLNADDDSGGGTNSQLDITLSGSGPYELWVNSYGADETGAYTLSVDGVGEAAGLPTVALGQSLSDQLTTADPVLSDNSHYRTYLYRGTPGEQILVTMRSSAFDSFLSGGRILGDRFEALESDDDSGGGRDAQLLATVGNEGTYAIRANSWGAGETGSFTLTVQSPSGAQATLPDLPAGQPAIAAGDRITAALQPGDPILGDSSYYHQYLYRGSPGDRVRITMTSGEFDTYLRWGRVEGDRIQSEAFDDDSAGGTNAQLEVTVGGTGTYAVQANSYSAGQTGAYTLIVERLTSGSPVVAAPESPSGLAGKWIHAYMDSAVPAFRSLGQVVKQWRPLEDLTDEMNRRYPLPRNVQVSVDECGFINAYYSPANAQIVFCYELIDYLANIFANDRQWTPEQQEAVQGAFRFILMHEVGHALVDQLDLPITGREEDAVDQLAAVMLIGLGEKGAQAALNGVQALQPSDRNFEESDYAGEHSLGPVRLYNMACWIYGSNPQRYSNLVDSGFLPEDRAVRCPGEWDQMEKAWQRLLAPHSAQ